MSPAKVQIGATFRVAAVSAAFAAVRVAQDVAPATAASLTGSVRDDSNNPVQATVTIATQGLRRSQLTAANGPFSFSNLKTGMDFACAIPPPGTNGQHCVDSCLWRDRKPQPYTPWLDTAHNYVHTRTFWGLLSGLALCGNSPSTSFHLFQPPTFDVLFQQIEAVIGAN